MEQTGSVGVQADISDPEGVLGIIRSFQEQLGELQSTNDSLAKLRNIRQESIKQTEALSQTLNHEINELVHHADVMETQIMDHRQDISCGDKELEDLINEKERLETEAGEIHGQEVAITNHDLDNEQRLTCFVEEEVCRKMEDLSFLHQRLTAATEEYQKQWNEFKNDLTRNKEEKNAQQETTDHVHELALARYIGMHSQSDGENSDMDLTQRLVSHHWNTITHRQLQQQLHDSQIKEKDLEDEIGELTNKKRTLWKRCLDLENCLDELKDTSEETNLLRPSSAYSDLPQVMEGSLPRNSTSGQVDIEAEVEASHGLMLHRCHKHTNISICESQTDENESTAVTKVDTGALYIVSDKIDSGKKDNELPGNKDNELPAPPRDEPDADQEPEPENGTDNNIDHLQSQLQQVTSKPISDADTMDNNLSLLSKLRKRMGGGIRSSSQRNRAGNKMNPSGSTKRFEPDFGDCGNRGRR